MLRGNFSAKIDDKGRLKIPTLFRTAIEDRYGTQLFITSLTGDLVRIYPMQVWTEVERKLAQVPSTLPARAKYFERVNYFGQPGEFDRQGRGLDPHPAPRHGGDGRRSRRLRAIRPPRCVEPRALHDTA